MLKQIIAVGALALTWGGAAIAQDTDTLRVGMSGAISRSPSSSWTNCKVSKST